MNNLILLFTSLYFFSAFSFPCSYAQVMKTQDDNGSLGGLLFRREFNKDVAEAASRKFVCQNILKIPQGQLVKVEIDALTASKSGELTTVFYKCQELDKKGLLFIFYNEYANRYDFEQEYLGYTYKNLEDAEADELMNKVNDILELKDAYFKTEYNHAALYFSDLTFVFAENWIGTDFIKVFYKNYVAHWNDSNFKRAAKRYIKKEKKFK